MEKLKVWRKTLNGPDFLLFFLLVVVSVDLFALIFDLVKLSPKQALASMPPLNFAVVQDRQVGPLLTNATNGSIMGQDGGASVYADNQSIWTFGDTFVFGGSMIHNSVAKTTDFNASDGINLTYKIDSGGKAVPLLSSAPGELAVWPDGMVQTQPGYVYFYYDPNIYCSSCSTDPNWQWKAKGVGLAKFDTQTMNATRTGVFWDDGTYHFGGARPLISGDYVYVFFGYRLARVTKSQIGNLQSYYYWNGTSWVLNGWSQAVNLWNETYPANGLSVSYNNYLAKWLAVYTPGYAGSVDARVADNLTGPWSDPVTLIKCSDFVSGNWPLCYSGVQHPEFQKGSGQTIYITFANSQSGKLYLHEVTLAKVVSSPTPSPSPTSPPKIPPCYYSDSNGKHGYGDVTGDGMISMDDANLIGEFVVGTKTPTALQRILADVNNDKSVSMVDAMLVGQYSSGLISTFSICSVVPTPTPAPISTGITTTVSGNSVFFSWAAQSNQGLIAVWSSSSPAACANVNTDVVNNSGLLAANTSAYTWNGAPNGNYKAAFVQYVAGNTMPVGCVSFTVGSVQGVSTGE